jgi:hypothetical protein
MSIEHPSPSDSADSPLRVSGKLFVIILIPVIIIALAWAIYARMNFRPPMPPPTTATRLP